MKTGNLQYVKQMNKSIVFERIKQLEPLSRADIAQNTGLNKGTVSSLVAELLDESLVFESGPGESSGGRRPVLLHYNKKAGYAIGIDIGVNYLLGIVSDLVGTIHEKKYIPLNKPDYLSFESILFNLIEELIHCAPKSPYGIIGIGIGVPGLVTKNQEIRFTPNLSWDQMNLKSNVEAHFNLPVIIENEANAGAYGEKLYGAGRNLDDQVYISAGIGIGTGIIIDGILYRGTSGFSGEMGHMTIDMNGKKCRCGNYGCWELYASELALLNLAKEKLPHLNPAEETTLERLIELADQQDEAVQDVFKRIGEYLGIGIVSIINSYNPKKIIIGNRLALAQKWLEESIYSVLEERTFSYNSNSVNICFSELSSLSSAQGASAFVVEQFTQELFKID